MTDNRPPENRQKLTSKAAKERRPYQRPSFRYERVFETTALSCGKLVGSSGSCISQHKTS
jgi:hypothetical protein